MFTLCSNGFASLIKIAAMPIYGKNTLKYGQGIIQRMIQYSGYYSKYDLQRLVHYSGYYSKYDLQRLVQDSGYYSKYDLQRLVHYSGYYSKMARVLFSVWFSI